MDMNRKIRFLVMDVDGTLTDGKIIMGAEGELYKSFDVKDGCGIFNLLPKYSIIPAVITARESGIVRNRCDELKIKEVHQNCCNKKGKLQEILRRYSERDSREYTLADCAYMGDDIPDLQCMKAVREAGGLAGCPADAAESVKRLADFVSGSKGGNGAVREFIEYIIDMEEHSGNQPRN